MWGCSSWVSSSWSCLRIRHTGSTLLCCCGRLLHSPSQVAGGLSWVGYETWPGHVSYPTQDSPPIIQESRCMIGWSNYRLGPHNLHWIICGLSWSMGISAFFMTDGPLTQYWLTVKLCKETVKESNCCSIPGAYLLATWWLLLYSDVGQAFMDCLTVSLHLAIVGIAGIIERTVSGKRRGWFRPHAPIMHCNVTTIKQLYVSTNTYLDRSIAQVVRIEVRVPLTIPQPPD